MVKNFPKNWGTQIPVKSSPEGKLNSKGTKPWSSVKEIEKWENK